MAQVIKVVEDFDEAFMTQVTIEGVGTFTYAHEFEIELENFRRLVDTGQVVALGNIIVCPNGDRYEPVE